MGFRSTFTTQDYAIEWPKWFVEKYNGSINFKKCGSGALHSSAEHKTYDVWLNLHTDIQKAINWVDIDKFVLVYLHECGGITRCQIEKNNIKWSEPLSWKPTDGVKHHYCYECSDI